MQQKVKATPSGQITKLWGGTYLGRSEVAPKTGARAQENRRGQNSLQNLQQLSENYRIPQFETEFILADLASLHRTTFRLKHMPHAD